MAVQLLKLCSLDFSFLEKLDANTDFMCFDPFWIKDEAIFQMSQKFNLFSLKH